MDRNGSVIKLRLLGRFQLVIDGSSVTRFRSDKVRALLAYLALESDRPHARAQLASLLWGEFDDKAARANLRKALFLLRQTLGESADQLLTLSRQEVVFHSALAEVDAHLFLRLADGIDFQDLLKAANLYQDQFLTGFDLRDAPEFEHWLTGWRSHLCNRYLDLLHQLGELYLAQKAYPSSEEMARKQLRLDPWYEPALQQLMRIYAADGRRNEALTAYERFVSQLQAELGIGPSITTEALATAVATETVDQTYLHNQTAPLSPLIGRDADLERLISRLSRSDVHLLTVTGPGGIGKTRLALEAAIRLSGRLHSYFLPLGGITTQAALWQYIGERLEIEARVGGRVERAVIAFLRQQPSLLIFDNYEQLLPHTTVIEHLLAEVPHIQFLITSRAPLNLRAEWRLPLEGLGYPAEDELEIDTYPAVALLMNIGQQVQPTLLLTPQNRPYIAALCRVLAGIPLALEMAASWLSLYSPQLLVEELNRNLDFLVSTRSDVPERHRTLRAIFDYALGQLNKNEKRLLQRLTVFQGDFSMRGVQAVLNGSPLTLRKLLDHALVQQRQADHFGLHPVLEHFLREDGVGLHDLKEERIAHARYYLQRIAPICDYNVDVTVKDISYELANVRAAWDWAVTQGETALLESAVDGQLAYYQFRGSFVEGRTQFGSAADLLEDPTMVSRLRFAEAECLQQMGNAEAAIAAIRPLAESVSNSIRLEALIRLGELYLAQRSFSAAETALNQAFELSVSDSETAATILCLLGSVYTGCRQLEKGIPTHHKSIKLAARLGDELLVADNYAHLARAWGFDSQFEASFEAINDALSIARRLEHKGKEALYLEIFGELCWQASRLEAAEEAWEEALTIAEQLNHKRQILRSCQHLALLASRMKDVARATQYEARTADLAEQLGETPLPVVLQ